MKSRSLKRLLASVCAVGLMANFAVPAYAADTSRQVIKQIGISNTEVQNDSESDRLIIKYEDFASDTAKKKVEQKLVSDTESAIDKVPDAEIITIDASETEKEPLELVELFKAEHIVEYAEIDAVVRMSAVIPNDSYYASYQASALSVMQVQDAWDIAKGSNAIVVAVVDSGIDPNHPDLQGRVLSGYDFVNNDSNPMDDNGHGTMSAGIIAANTNNSKGIAGGDWNCYVLPVKVLDSHGDGLVSNFAAGIRYAADNGADIINCSLGTTSNSQALQDAVNYAHDKEAIVVAATGNTASAIQYPAACNNVITVGSITTRKTLADYSCYGSQMDLVAVGSDITSTYSNGSTVSYGKGTGTSYATPYVSSLASLILSLNKDLTPDQVLTAMKNNAIDLGAPGWDEKYGYGCVAFGETLKSISEIKNTPPVIKINGEETVTGCQGDRYTDEGATATDEEDGDITAAIKVENTVNTNVVGTYTVKYTVVDKANNSTTAIRTVVVKENSKPVITLKGQSVIELNAGDSYFDAGAIASDAEDGNLTWKIDISGVVDTTTAGTYHIYYNVKDSKGLAADTVSRTINVKGTEPPVVVPPVVVPPVVVPPVVVPPVVVPDPKPDYQQPQKPTYNNAPVITLNGSGALSMERGSSYSDAGARAYDIEDGDLTWKVEVDGYVDTNRVGKYTITYTVTDSNGASARPVTRNVTIFAVDRSTAWNSRPTIKLCGSSYMTVPYKSNFEDPGVKAVDNEDGDISFKVNAVGDVDTSRAGTYKVVYSVRDSQGLESIQITRIITVNANKRPVIRMMEASTMTVKLGSNYHEYGAVVNDYEDGNITANLEIEGYVNTKVAGSYMLKYSAKDSDGLVSKTLYRYVVVAP